MCEATLDSPFFLVVSCVQTPIGDSCVQTPISVIFMCSDAYIGDFHVFRRLSVIHVFRRLYR
jgi:hypothetical protein